MTDIPKAREDLITAAAAVLWMVVGYLILALVPVTVAIWRAVF